MAFDLVSLLIGLAVGGAAGSAFLWPRLVSATEKLKSREEAQADMGNSFSAMAQEALKQSNEQFLQLAQERLKNAQSDGAHDLEKRQKSIKDMIDPVKEHLEKLGGAVEQIKGTDQALREDLRNLQQTTAKLAGAMRDPAAQGKWGEYILERLLDKSGLIKGIHYESQVTIKTDDGSSQRPDVIIHLQDGFNIVVDAKAPINEFVDKLQEELSEAEHKDALTRLAKAVREHVKSLGKKSYWEKLDSPDFVVLFLPSEHLFSAALLADSELVDFASEHRIVIASPTLLISLLRVVGLSWRQVELAKNAQDISALGTELYKRMSAFGGHMEKVGKGLLNAMNNYNSAVGSLERSVLPSARKFKELHVQDGGKEIADMPQLDVMPRSLTVPELTNGADAPALLEDTVAAETEETEEDASYG